MWAFTIFARPASERSSKISVTPGLLRETAGERSAVGGAKIMSAHIRRFSVSKAQGEWISHSAMLRGKSRGVTKAFLAVPARLYSGLDENGSKWRAPEKQLKQNKKLGGNGRRSNVNFRFAY